MRFELDITLTPSQQKIDDDTKRFQIIRAGRKFGKTTYALYRLIRAAGKKNAIVWYIAPTYKQAKLIAWRDLKRLIPSQFIETKNESDLTIDLVNGATIYLMGADSPDSLRGPNPDFVVLEEAAMHEGNVWEEIVRPALTTKKARALFITTPKGLNWFYELEEQAKKHTNDWAIFHFTVYDNPYIDRQEIEKARAECKSEIFWRQEYLADYEAHMGRAFPAYKQDKHFLVLPPYRAGETMYLSIDWGQSDDTAGTFFVIRGEKLCVLDYHAQAGLGARQQAQILRRIAQDKGYSLDRAVLSHDAFRVDPDRKGDTVAYRFIDELYPTPVDRSDRLLKARTDLLITLTERNQLLINKTLECEKLSQDIIRAEWKDNVGREMKGKMDGIDSLGYGAMNVSYLLGLDKKIDLPHTNSEDEAPKTYLRGYPREEGTPVFDEVTGYIGNSVF